MVFQSGADDLPLVIKIFRPDESHHAIDQKWLEYSRYAIGAGLQSKLVNSVVSFSRKRAALAGLEVHDVGFWLLALSL